MSLRSDRLSVPLRGLASRAIDPAFLCGVDRLTTTTPRVASALRRYVAGLDTGWSVYGVGDATTCQASR
jgi:hypothetical protein